MQQRNHPPPHICVWLRHSPSVSWFPAPIQPQTPKVPSRHPLLSNFSVFICKTWLMCRDHTLTVTVSLSHYTHSPPPLPPILCQSWAVTCSVLLSFSRIIRTYTTSRSPDDPQRSRVASVFEFLDLCLSANFITFYLSVPKFSNFLALQIGPSKPAPASCNTVKLRTFLQYCTVHYSTVVYSTGSQPWP